MSAASLPATRPPTQARKVDDLQPDELLVVLFKAPNLIAAIVMGVYMWRTHPKLGQDLNHALSGTP